VTFPRGLRSLNNRDYRLYLSGQVLSQIGRWMQSVAQAWLVLELTGSPLQLGLISTLQFTPMLLFSVFSGAVADRFSKRRLLMFTKSVSVAQSLALAALVGAGVVQYWHVALLALLLGLINTLDNPTRQSFVSELVREEDVGNAVALSSAGFNSARIVGPAIGGILIARLGFVPAIVINGLGFVFPIAALALMRTPEAPRPPRTTTMLEEVSEGIAYALRTPLIRLALGMLFVVSLFVFNFNVYVPLLARAVLHQEADGFGFLMASVGLGAVSGALALGAFGRTRPTVPVTLGASAIACAGIFLMSAVHEFWAGALALFVTGLFSVVVTASCNTILQLTAPSALRGRVMSLYTLVFGGTVPFGAFVVGFVSEHWGVPMAFLAMGAAGLVGTAALFTGWRLRLH
jgi:MFS family permease